MEPGLERGAGAGGDGRAGAYGGEGSDDDDNDAAGRRDDDAAEPGAADVVSLAGSEVVGLSGQVRSIGEDAEAAARSVVAELVEVSAALAALGSLIPGGVRSGPAIEGCAHLLHRRAGDVVAETARIADLMLGSVRSLDEADALVSGRVARAAG